jgi:hypothetical protein
LRLIETKSRKYASEQSEVEIWLTIIYAGMVAEENKENAVLKKRIKHLGMHQLLIKNIFRNRQQFFPKAGNGGNWTKK